MYSQKATSQIKNAAKSTIISYSNYKIIEEGNDNYKIYLGNGYT